MTVARTILTVSLLACLLAGGCARHAPLEDMAAGGADVGVRATTFAGEELTGRLVSLTEETLVVEVAYEIVGDVKLAGVGEFRRVVVDGEEVPGTIADVERSGERKTALVVRTFPLNEVSRITFHESQGESSLATVVSHLLGPIIGIVLAALI